MIAEWKLPKKNEGLLGLERRRTSVLVEVDGPLLAEFRDEGGRRLLGLRADEDDTTHRWLLAPVDELGLEALARGLRDVRSVFADRGEVEVADFRGRKLETIWRTSVSSIPSKRLPVAGAPLPRDVRDRLQGSLGVKAWNRSVLRCWGDDFRKRAIPFAHLGALASSMQNVWRSITETMVSAIELTADIGTLRLCDIVEGSVGLEFSQENELLFAKTAQRYAMLVRSCASPMMAEQPASVRRAMSDHFRVISNHGIEVIAELGANTVYIGSDGAAAAREAFALAEAPPKAPAEDVAGFGFFDGLMIGKGRFTFFDTTRGRSIAGKVDRELKERLQREGGEEARIGRRTRYRATFHVTEADGREDFTLVSFEPEQKLLF